jgi:hypothetical protein
MHDALLESLRNPKPLTFFQVRRQPMHDALLESLRNPKPLTFFQVRRQPMHDALLESARQDLAVSEGKAIVLETELENVKRLLDGRNRSVLNRTKLNPFHELNRQASERLLTR